MGHADKLKEPMLKKKYAQWMYEWETRLTTRDEIAWCARWSGASSD